MDQYIGRLLDNRYEILEVIGTGGMAVVYKARCHRLNRLVAIKILKDEFARDEEFRRRFHAEGEAVAMLSHPNIVQVFDVSSSDNANFIVMELVDGISLKQYMEKKGVLNWKETLHFSMQIAKGLEHAHSRGIVHRDIKPHNVMVLKNGSVKVMDFGIARVMSKSNTLTKEALGSVHYISPEQAKGGYTDNRSDLYSLSVVMYEMMTGRPPYDGESPVAVAIQHINGGAPMPSTLNPNIPGGLEQIIMHGMALDPNDRYASATEMLRDMDEFRKDPAILFHYKRSVVSDATQPVILTPGVQKPRTTAERVAVRRGDEPPARVSSTSRVQTGRKRTSTSAARRDSEKPPVRRRRRAEEESRSRMAIAAIVACSVVAVLAIIIFLVALFSGALFSQSRELVEVPQLLGVAFEDVEDSTDFIIAQDVPEYNEDYAKGLIIRQTPSAGETVEKGTTITVVVSMGAKPAVETMTDLRGQTLENALEFLRIQGMNPLPVEEFSDEVEEGKVIRTNPTANTELTPGQKVEVYYSVGPVIKTGVMPNVVDLDYATAMKRLDDLGFTNVKTVSKESDEDKDTVIAQSVASGTEIDLTEEITLTISKGSGVTKASVPSVVGMSYKDAVKRMNDYGFTNIEPEYVEDDADANQVIRQSVSQGMELDVNTKITLTVSTGPAATSPEDTSVTKQLKISLPERDAAYVLRLQMNGQDVIEPTTIQPGTTEITVELTGSGTQSYTLLIDDETYTTLKVDFSA